MLNALRKQTQNTFILAVLGVIVIVFIFFFGPQTSGFGPGGRQQAGVAAGTKIYDTQITAAYGRLEARNGRMPRASDAQYQSMRRELLLDMALVHVLADRAEEAGINVSEDEVSCYIVNWHRGYQLGGESICQQFPSWYRTYYTNYDFLTFYSDNGVLSEYYRQEVRSRYQMAVEEYQEYKRSELLALKYLDFVALSLTATDGMVEDLYARRAETLQIEYVEIRPSAFSDLAPSEAEVEAYAVANEAELRAQYEENSDDYVEERQVRVRRLFVAMPDGVPRMSDPERETFAEGEAYQEALARYEDLLEQAGADGADFEALVREHTDAEAQRASGGDMGMNTRSQMSGPLYDATVDMAVGDVTGIEGDFGWSIIKLEEEVEERQLPFEEVRGQIAETRLIEERRESADELAHARAERLLALAATSDDLNAAVESEFEEAMQAARDAAAAAQPPTSDDAEPTEGQPNDGETTEAPEPAPAEVPEPPSFAVVETDAFGIDQTDSMFQVDPMMLEDPALAALVMPPPTRIPTFTSEVPQIARAVWSMQEAGTLHPSIIEENGNLYIVRLVERTEASEVPEDEAAGLLTTLTDDLQGSIVYGRMAEIDSEVSEGEFITLRLDDARRRLLLNDLSAERTPFLQALLDESLANGQIRVEERLFAVDPTSDLADEEPGS